MRKAGLKIELAYYQGRRVAFSDAIHILLDEGLTKEGLIDAYRDEYRKSLDYESKCAYKIYNKETECQKIK